MTNELPTSIRLGMRLAGDRLKLLDGALTDIRSTFTNNGRFNSDRHIRAVRESALLAYREAAAAVIGAIISMKGNNAKNRRPELEAALGEFAAAVAAGLNDAEAVKGFMQGTFDEELAAAKARILADFDDGCYHMTKDDRPHVTTQNITMRDNHGNVAAAAGGAVQNFAGGQSVGGVAKDGVLALLAELRAEVERLEANRGGRDAALDAIISATREAQEDQPNPGRLKRLLASVGNVGVKIGISATGGVLAKLILLANNIVG